MNNEEALSQQLRAQGENTEVPQKEMKQELHRAQEGSRRESVQQVSFWMIKQREQDFMNFTGSKSSLILKKLQYPLGTGALLLFCAFP